MGTAERWTFPSAGYPQLLQIGERRADLQPYIDAQHPHASPIMGLTLSDTIRLSSGEKDHLRLFFSPRGEATDGPVAYMHRPTGRFNPDTPLGHHIGQDVGHITSTVLGGSLKLGDLRLEASAFHGEEPRPTRIELGVGRLDSAGARVIAEISENLTVMGSVAFVNDPEPYVDSSVRFGASAYQQAPLSDDWTIHNAIIYGGITDYDHAKLLHSLAEEVVFSGGTPNVWARVELLQRTPGELEINGAADRDAPRWVGAATLGYTHTVYRIAPGLQLGAGGSVTRNFVPDVFTANYGESPWGGKVFVQITGMKMWRDR